MSVLTLQLYQVVIECRIIGFDIFDTKLFNVSEAMFHQFFEQGLDLPEKLFKRQFEGIDRPLHALEKVHAHQVDKALFVIDLTKERLTTLDIYIVLAGRTPLDIINRWLNTRHFFNLFFKISNSTIKSVTFRSKFSMDNFISSSSFSNL